MSVSTDPRSQAPVSPPTRAVFVPPEPDWDLTPIERVPPGQVVRDTLTLAHRGLQRMRRSPQQLFDAIVLPIGFTVGFASIFGGSVAGGVTGYLAWLVPGVLVSVAVTTSVITGAQLREDIDSGVFDRLVSLPIARISPLSGLLVSDTLRYLIATCTALGTGLVMGYRPASAIGVVAGLALVVFTTFAISWIFALMGVLFRKVTAIHGVSMLVMLPLTFTSNAFVPTSTMPDWLATVAGVNPVSALITSFRSLAGGDPSIDIIWTLTGAVIVVAVFAPITMRAYLRRV